MPRRPQLPPPPDPRVGGLVAGAEISQGSAAEFLTAPEVAELLRISARTLEAWRAKGEGPPHQKHGRRVAYRRDLVESWARNQETKGAGRKQPDPLKEAEAVTAWPYANNKARYQVSMPYLHPITGEVVRPRKLAPADRDTLASAIKWGEAERLRLVTAIVRDAPKPEPKEEPKPDPKPKPLPPTPRAPTLAEIWPEFETSHIAAQKLSTRDCYLAAWKHIRTALGDVSLDKIDAVATERTKTALLGAGLQLDTVRLYMQKLARAIRWAMAKGKLPLALVPRPDLAPVKKRRVKIYTPEDIESIVDGAHDQYERTLVLFLTDGCLRKGEVAALQWSDIQWGAGKHGTVWVTKNVVKGVLQGSAKGEDGEVPLTPRLAEALRELRAEEHSGTWILPRRRGHRWKVTPIDMHGDGAAIARIIVRLEADAGLEPHGPHRIRHSRLTHLAETGLPVRALQHLARHAQESTTEKYYLHVNKRKMATMATDAIEAMTPSESGKVPGKSRQRAQIRLIRGATA